MIGRERKTERKTRMTLGLRRFFWEGRTRERDIGGGGGGGGCAASAGGAEDLFSPIGWLSQTYRKRRPMPLETEGAFLCFKFGKPHVLLSSAFAASHSYLSAHSFTTYAYSFSILSLNSFSSLLLHNLSYSQGHAHQTHKTHYIN